MNWLRRIWLFVRIVWRPWETERLDIRTAWGISSVCWEKSFIEFMHWESRREVGL